MDYLKKIRAAVREGQATSAPRSESVGVTPGLSIEWSRAGERVAAVVDFIHTDETGTPWAFCTTPEGWVAVNLRYALAR